MNDEYFVQWTLSQAILIGSWSRSESSVITPMASEQSLSPEYSIGRYGVKRMTYTIAQSSHPLLQIRTVCCTNWCREPSPFQARTQSYTSKTATLSRHCAVHAIIRELDGLFRTCEDSAAWAVQHSVLLMQQLLGSLSAQVKPAHRGVIYSRLRRINYFERSLISCDFNDFRHFWEISFKKYGDFIKHNAVSVQCNNPWNR